MAGRNYNRKLIRRMIQISALGGLLGLGIWIFLASRIDYPTVVRFGDGSPQGRYAMLNAALYPRLASALEKKFGSRLEIVHTQGSLENLRKVESGELHLAFCQEGVGHSEKVRSVIGMNCVVELVPPRTLPRTSSGKLSRAKARNLYLSGEIQPYSIAA